MIGCRHFVGLHGTLNLRGSFAPVRQKTVIHDETDSKWGIVNVPQACVQIPTQINFENDNSDSYFDSMLGSILVFVGD